MTARRDNLSQNIAALIASYKAVNDRVMAGEKPSDEQLVAALFTGGAAAINIVAGMAIDLERLASAAERLADALESAGVELKFTNMRIQS